MRLNLLTRKITCKGRSMKSCKNAKKSCKYISGTKRKYCRRRQNYTRFIKKSI